MPRKNPSAVKALGTPWPQSPDRYLVAAALAAFGASAQALPEDTRGLCHAPTAVTGMHKTKTEWKYKITDCTVPAAKPNTIHLTGNRDISAASELCEENAAGSRISSVAGEVE